MWLEQPGLQSEGNAIPIFSSRIFFYRLFQLAPIYALAVQVPEKVCYLDPLKMFVEEQSAQGPEEN